MHPVPGHLSKETLYVFSAMAVRRMGVLKPLLTFSSFDSSKEYSAADEKV